jgi:hypothetical protein
MKKLVLLVVLLGVMSVAAVSALGLYVTPGVDLNIGVNNIVKGGDAGGQLFLDLGLIAVGLEAKADYDATFNVANFPVLLLVGLGRNFWVGAGYTIAAVAPFILGTDGVTHILWEYGGFPNTYALGANIFRIPTLIGGLVFQTELSYTLNGLSNPTDPLSASVGQLIAIFAGLKWSVGVGLELPLLK